MPTLRIWLASASYPCRRKAPREVQDRRELAEELRAAGYEAATVDDQRLVGASDRHLSEVCKTEGRIFATLDLDFADIRTYPPDEHPGLIVLRPVRQDKSHIVEVFRRTLKAVGYEPLEGRLWIVEEKRIRIR